LGRGEPLVVAVEDRAPGADDVEAVVRLVIAAEAVGAAQHDPDAELPGQRQDRLGLPVESIPV
jgi:hypothetical protein